MRKKCQYSEFFWFAFSHIWTEYGDLVRSPYSVRMRENADLKNFEYGHFLRSVKLKKTIEKIKSYQRKFHKNRCVDEKK